MLLFIIVVLVFIYLIGGAVIGVSASVNKAWPVYNEGCTFADFNKSAPFFFACGPLFWVVLAFRWLFSKIWNMIDWDT